MSAMVPPKQQVTVRADLNGYVLHGQAFDGFADRPDLPLVDRVAIARMARSYAHGALSEEQRRLLVRDDARPRRASALLRGFTENALEDEKAYREGLYAQLTARQRRAIAEKHFPVTVGQLARLVGATDRQIRHWTDRGLLPAHRVAGQRRYFTAAAVQAASYVRLDKQQMATLAALVYPSPRSAALLSVVGATLTTLAQRVGGKDVQQDLVEAGICLQHVGTMKISKQLVSERGFGYIAQSDGTEIFFHRSQVHGARHTSHEAGAEPGAARDGSIGSRAGTENVATAMR